MARQCLERVENFVLVEPDHGDALSFGISALAALGEKERARSWIRRSLLLDPDNVRLRYNIACTLAQLGEPDEALDLLEGVLRALNVEVLRFMKADPSLVSLRHLERYQAIVADAESRFGPS